MEVNRTSAAETVTGVVDPAFEAVRERFETLICDGDEGGASVAVLVDGDLVVDLVGGWANARHSQPWQPDTLAHTYSVSKPFAALAVLALAAEGHLALDMAVADVWPEYAEAGKGSTTVRHLLTHQAGLPAFGPTLSANDLFEADLLRSWLANSPPAWVPGTAHGEHALTYGHLLDGVVRAVTGATLGEVFRSRIAEPLGWDAWFGVPLDEISRVADLEYLSPLWPQDIAGTSGTLRHQALTQPQGALEVNVLNHTRWRQTEFPAIGLHSNARAVVALYGELLQPAGALAHIIGSDLFVELLRPQLEGLDRTLDRDVSWTLGMQRDGSDVGMGGIGGSVGFASLDKRYAFAYVTRSLGDHGRADVLVNALELVLGR